MCPWRSCGSAVLLETSSSAGLCSECNYALCVACKKTYHRANKCYEEKGTEQKGDDALQALPESEEALKALWDDYKSGSAQRQHLLERRFGQNVILSPLDFRMSEKWIDMNTKACPHCFCKTQKNGGCSLMHCTQCNRRFIWE